MSKRTELKAMSHPSWTIFRYTHYANRAPFMRSLGPTRVQNANAQQGPV